MEVLSRSGEAWDSLDDVRDRWGVRESMLREWLARGALRAHLWLPLMSVFQLEGGRIPADLVQGLTHWEGYVPVSRHLCRRVFRSGRASLRGFEAGEETYALPDTAEDVVFDATDLVILEADRLQFERQHGLGATERTEAGQVRNDPDPMFRSVGLGGRVHRFGEIQARVLQILHRCALAGEPWQNGKRILVEAGSQSFTMANLFKRHPAWQEVIQSDGRGAYRLHEDLLSPSSEAP